MIDGLVIKETIRNHGLTVNEVASRMGISRVTLSTHINGNPSVEVLYRIASAIGCEVTELFKTNTTASQSNSITCPHCGKLITLTVGSE